MTSAPTLTLVLAFSFSGLAPLHGSPSGDWPCWRGLSRDNISRETRWSTTGAERPLWRATIGRGYSQPIVAGGRLFATGYFEDAETPHEGVDRVVCLDAESGDVLWMQSYASHAYDNEHAGGTLSTPTCHEGVLYVPTRDGHVRAFAADDGRLLWDVDLVARHEVEPGRYGFASSPYVIGSRIVLNASRCVALERATGETAWISEPLDANYSTVAEMSLDGGTALLAFGGEGLFALDADDGVTLRHYVFRKSPRNVEGATPVVLGTRAIVSSGYDQGLALVDFATDEPDEVLRSRRMRTKMAGPTLHDGYLYGFDESVLKCMDLDGREQWRVRGLGHGALSVAGDRLLFTSSDGELLVARATPERYEELGRRDWIDSGVFWTAPVLANGLIYLRGSEGQLVCLDHRAPALEAGQAHLMQASDGGANGGSAGSDEAKVGGSPSPASLVAAHLRATGLDALDFRALHFRGRLHNTSLGLADVGCEWTIEAGGRHSSRFELPFDSSRSITRYFDGERGWEVNPYMGDKWLSDEEQAELRATGGCQLLLQPCDVSHSTFVGPAVFRGLDCWRVDERLDEARTRRVYFERETGRLAGREQSEEATVLLGGWRRAGELWLPFERTEFDRSNGEEWRWRFEAVDFEPLEDALFTPPKALSDPPSEDPGEHEPAQGGDSKGE